MMHAHAVLVTLALILAPLGARAADLVVWWEKGDYAQEDEALREIIAAFEQESGKQVELVLHPQEELPDKIEAALEAGQPPDFAFGLWHCRLHSGMGPRGSARGPDRRCRATSRTCSIRSRSTGLSCSTRRPGRRAL